MYTFENYANAGESRKWIEKFRAEHNAGLQGKACPTSTILAKDNNVWVRLNREDAILSARPKVKKRKTVVKKAVKQKRAA